MPEIQTQYGKLLILSLEDIFERQALAIEQICATTTAQITVGLTGGSTPKAFYRWVAEKNVFNEKILKKIFWMTSDERYVPLDSDQSNFGNADRLMLTPLKVSTTNKRPWSITSTPSEAAKNYNSYFDQNKCFDLCILGMGDDSHIASIFPGSPLIHKNDQADFEAIELPEKGTRLTITPSGLNHCGKIIMTVTGQGKSFALKNVIQGPFDPKGKPAQLHKNWPEKVTWLVDTSAASELDL